MASEWTITTLKEHFDALREADQRALQIKELGDKEARRIKDESDKKALELQTETQKYKDEKANELREQISRERSLYVTQAQLYSSVDKLEVMIKPIANYVTSQQGRSQGLNTGWGVIIGAFGLVGIIFGIIRFFIK